jgi:bifunctional UDP-N-acetylglucosamine pyrophosphorylase/glucosamine-1-phosphate N-acetyltransferase
LEKGNKGINMPAKKPETSLKETAQPLTAIIMAAGKGTRMKSPLPKVLHPVAGQPMILRSIQAARGAGATEIRLIVGHGQNLVRNVVESTGVICFEQKQQLGTADAIKSAQVEDLEGEVLIMNGDHPLVEIQDLKMLFGNFRELGADLAVVTAVVKKPGELGRVVRQGGVLHAIVEARDASADTLRIREINTGFYVMKASLLKELLPQIKNDNSKGEYYLTDLITLAQKKGYKVEGLRSSARVAHGVNTQMELAKASKYLFKKKATQLMEEGVLILDADSVYIEEIVKVGPGTVIYPNVFLRGRTEVGSFCVLEPQVFVSDCLIGQSVQIKQGSYLEKSEVHNSCSVGPYARLRPETVLKEEAHIGNFVELKKTIFGKKSKAGHLAYLGDAEIGDECNIGCGAITVNFAADKKKYKTKIGNKVFVGSDVQLIAPIEIGDEAVLGAGSVITKAVPARGLGVTRAKQFTKENYVVTASSESQPEKKET